MSVAVQDANNNTETADNATTVTLAIDNNPSAGVLTCTNTGGLTVTVASGVANFTGCAITKAGTGYTLKASSTPAHTAPANANAFNITAGTASTTAVSSGSGQSATVGAAFTNPLVALVSDANGNPVPLANVTFTPPLGPPHRGGNPVTTCLPLGPPQHPAGASCHGGALSLSPAPPLNVPGRVPRRPDDRPPP